MNLINRHRRIPYLTTLLLYFYLFFISSLTHAEEITLQQVMALLAQHNPSLASAVAQQEQAIGALTTAKAYPNPDLEVAGGTSTGLGAGALNGSNQMSYVAQALDLPFVREARREVAEAGIDSAEQEIRAVWLIVQAKTQQAFYEILRRQAELAITQENEKLLGQIYDKVALKVQVGEASNYEAVKAQAELMNAIKLRNTALVQVEDTKSALRALFMGALPESFSVTAELPLTPAQLPSLEHLRKSVLAQQPLLQHTRIEVQKAQAQLHLQEQMRYPVPTVKAGVESDPGLQSWRIGISVPLPLWNQRQGPIAEAHASLRKFQAEAEQQQLTIIRELEHAYNRYLIADQQVQIFETGLLKQAEKALKVAEAAYRLGERGILDYLDAQRAYRNVRNDYINAKFDRQNALIDLEKLNAAELKDKT